MSVHPAALPTSARESLRHVARTAWRAASLRVALVALAATLVAAPAALGAQVLNFRQYTSAEGLPQSQVMAMRQDRDGYVWFATYGGLTRFDGSEFRTYTKADGLSSNSVFDIVEDRAGRLLLATAGGLCVREAGRFRCVRQKDGLVSDNARSLALDSAGGVWVGTLGGLSHVDAKGVVRNYGTAHGLPAERVIRVVVDSAGRAWVATPKGLVGRVGDRFLADVAPPLGDSVQFIAPAGSGLLIGVSGGLFLRRGNLVTAVAPGAIAAGTSFADGALDPDGTIWAATRDGVLRIRDGRVDRIGRENGLLSDMVNRVLVDREGTVWFGTETGASKHVPGPFRTYTAGEGLPSPFARAMAVDRRGRLWVGTRRGVAVREGDRFVNVPLPGGADNRVFALTREPNGGMLVGTRRGLLWVRDSESAPRGGGAAAVRVYREADGIPGEAVYALHEDGRGGVWIGTERGLARWERGRIATVGPPEITRPGVISLARDARGRLWLGRIAGGIAVLDESARAVRVIGPAQGGSDQTIWDLHVDASGAVWGATNGDGAVRVDDAGVRRYTTRDGLASDFVWQVLADRRGHVWLFGNLGLDRFSRGGLRHYGRGDGLIELEGTASGAFEDDEGDLWFGTGSGLVRYTPGLDVPHAVAPPVYVEDATVDGRAFEIGAASRPRLARGVVRIRFASPTFRDESAVRFSYRLSGGADAWSPPTADKSVTYAGLAPGRYRFEVAAINGALQSRAPASLAFEVMPAWWQTWWFRAIGLTLLAAAAAGAPALRARRLDRERRRLEALVARHTGELAEKNARLEQSNRDLERFAYIASHDLQEPLRKIQAFSDRVTRGYGERLDDQGRDYLGRMSNAAARMQRLIEALLTLSRVTTKKQASEPIDLEALVLEVLGDLEVRIQASGGRVDLGELPPVLGDPVQVRQLFQNLVGNALKFHRPGITPAVRVSGRMTREGVVEIGVADNGIGFEAKDAEKVFLPFHRLHGRSQYEGTGIGLTICQKIVEGHGGTIRAEAWPNGGAYFVFTLPPATAVEVRRAA